MNPNAPKHLYYHKYVSLKSCSSPIFKKKQLFRFIIMIQMGFLIGQCLIGHSLAQVFFYFGGMILFQFLFYLIFYVFFVVTFLPTISKMG